MGVGTYWKNEEERQILAEVHRAFATVKDAEGNPKEYQEWFVAAQIHENHPVKMAKTLVIYCSYKPLLIMKEVQSLAEKLNLALYLQQVDKNGDPIIE